MPTTELQQMIDVVAKDKGIDPGIVISAIEDAYLAASRKVFKTEEDLRTRFNLETGQVELYAVKQIVAEVANTGTEISLTEAQQLYGEEAEIGMEIEFPKETEKLGRIAAQTAKQVIAQRVREAEREKIHAEFGQRIGEVVNAMVKRFESGDIIAEIGRVEPRFAQGMSRAENYAIGDRVRPATRRDEERQGRGRPRGPIRPPPRFGCEVPETGRHPSYRGRSRRCVFAERDVDPVGACAGRARVQAIIRELRGERSTRRSSETAQFRPWRSVLRASARHHCRRRAEGDGSRREDRRCRHQAKRGRTDSPRRSGGRHQERRRETQEVAAVGRTAAAIEAVLARQRSMTRSWRSSAWPVRTVEKLIDYAERLAELPGFDAEIAVWPPPRVKRHARAAAEKAWLAKHQTDRQTPNSTD
jgi:hypothetical protein